MITRFLLTASIAIVALCGPSTRASDPAPERVEIRLANFSFSPSTIRLKAGQLVTLHFVSNGNHDFAAPEFFKAASMDTATRNALGSKGKVDLESGETVDVTLTPKAGSYKARCTHFLHSTMGMTGTITVS